MKVLCFGSANLDHVYKVDHFTVPGETQGCLEYNIKCGGKGVNQAIAMAFAMILILWELLVVIVAY
ncbi:MAG: hypothetical protein ACLTMR_04170 [Faecalibacillus sp.]